MALNQKRYSYIIFLVSLISFTSNAQNATTKEPTSVDSKCVKNLCELNDQKNSKVTTSVTNLDISNQFIVELSIPKGGFTVDAVENDPCSPVDTNNQTTCKTAYSELVRTIIENYKYDFSETFIDILFFKDIDYARKRTI